MRIGIIGAGVSGMTAAWLLQHDHQVTLMDRADRLGGHIETLCVDVGGRSVHAELGPRFFFDSAYPHFLALLRVLRVPIRWCDFIVSFTDTVQSHTVVLPPRNLRHAAALLQSPRLVRHVLSLRRLIEEQPLIAARRDYSITLRQHLETHDYPATFGPEFAYPFLAACWGAPLDLLPEFPVYSLLKGMPPGKKPGSYEIDGGMARYVRALASELTQVDVRLGVEVGRIERNEDFVVEQADGVKHRFDRLIVATSSRDAAALLDGVPAVADMQATIGTFRHWEIEIAVHGDPSFMPRDRRDWANNNLFMDGEGRAWMSDWQGHRTGDPVIRTWLPKGRALPRPLYGHRSYHHVLMTPQSAILQRRIAAHQGRAGLWVTGMYAVDVDNHESALLSALVPVHALAPQSRNLLRLLDAVAPDAAHRLDVLPSPLCVTKEGTLRAAALARLAEQGR